MRGILTGAGRGLRVLVATTAATALAGAGLSLAAAPAPAFSGNVVGGCWIDQISSMIAPWTTGQTLSIDGKTGGSIELQAGDTVPISYKYDLGPNNGGPDLSTVDLTVTAYVGIFSGGTQVATVSKSGPTTKGVPNSANFPGQTISTTFTAPDAGSYTAKVVLVDFFAAYPGLPLHVACTGNGTSKPAAGTAPAPTPNYFTDGPSGVNVTQRTMNFVNDPSSPFAATDFTVTSGPTTEPKKPVDVQAQAG
ncbi:MAG TPA: hypothetical protein VFN19_05140, partial [Candidatus Nanopelagicales bacterium]|nr:hypothetical protein [Candidatus Nanopelagicales bacterium]